MAPLRRDLGLLEATSVTVGSMIGAGIFFAPSFTAGAFPHVGVLLALWAAGGVVTLCGALSVAELSALVPRAGGPYAFIREAYGEFWGFVAAWGYAVAAQAGIGASVATVFALHAARIHPVSDAGLKLLAAWAIVAVAFANWLGVRLGGLVQDALAAAKLAALGLVVAAAFLLPARGGAGPAGPAADANPGLALTSLLLAYNGWINATFLAEEVRDPRRTLPVALLLGVGFVTVAYVGVVAAYLHVLGPAGVAASSVVAADTLDAVLRHGGLAVAGAVVLSTFGNLHGRLLYGPRLPFALARDGLLPAAFSGVNRFGSPGASVAAMAGLTILLLFAGGFGAVVTFSIAITWGLLAAVVAAVFVLRLRRPGLERPYRAWGYPATPALFIAAVAAVLAVGLVHQPWPTAAAALVLASGAPVYLLMRSLRRHRPAPRDATL